MTKAFEQKVVREGIVDTATFRYVFDDLTGTIKRIRLEYLDTTAELDKDNWEIVKSMADN